MMNEHIMNLATYPIGQELAFKLINAINKITETPEGKAFAEPVNYVNLGLTDYLQLVKRPIDFNRIITNLQNHEYQYIYELLHDIALIFKNASIYNSTDDEFMSTIRLVEMQTKELLQRIDHRITPEVYHLIGYGDPTQFIGHQEPDPVTFGRFQLTLIKLKKLPERLASLCIYELCAQKGEVDSIHNTFRVIRPQNYTSKQLKFFEQRVAERYKEYIINKKKQRRQNTSK